MKNQRNKNLSMILPAFLLMFLAQADTAPEAKIPVPAQISSLDNLPAGLAPVVAKAVQDDLPATYQLKKSGDNFRADNPAQNMCFTFTPTGVRVQSADGPWEWHMTLTRWGCDGEMEPVPEADPVAKGGQLSYQRGHYLTEWYLNTTWGLEQGFTLDQKPSVVEGKSSKVILEFSLSGTLRPQLNNNDTLKGSRQALLLCDTRGQVAVRYSGLHAYDAEGKTLAARLEIVDDILRISVDDGSARYPITIDPWIQQAKLTASGGVSGDHFGNSIAISGDTVVVGARGDDSSRGAAYVFVKPVSGWTTTSTYSAKLTASDRAINDYFGISVAISGDTVVVGANCDDTNRGSAYIFQKPGGGWSGALTETAKLTASDRAINDYFGVSVAISGDTVVVGAYGDDCKVADCGSAYVFVKPVTGWATTSTYDAKLTGSTTTGGDWFGIRVAIYGDTVVVGAPRHDYALNSNRGVAYIFEKPGGGWSGTVWETAKLAATDGTLNDNLGVSVAIIGDTVAIGAYGDFSYRGSAYIFDKPGGGWSGTVWESAKLKASDAAENDYFGGSIAISSETVVVGADADDSNKGSVYIFEKPGGGWSGTRTETVKLTASDGIGGDWFGGSVGISGCTAVVGADCDDSNQGSAYVFELDNTPPNTPNVYCPACNGRYSSIKSPTWNWNSGGGGGSGWFRHKLDSGEWSSEKKDTFFTPSEELSEGEGIDHTLYVQERDAAENWSDSGSFTIEIDSAKPCSEALSPASATELNATLDITYTWDDVYDDGTICGEASSGSGVAQVDLYVMGPGESSYTLTDTDNEGSIDGIFQYTVTTEGIYHFKTIATDRAGNEEYKESESYDTKTIYASEFAGYAILAVGEIDGDPDGLLSHTLTANNVYQHLVNRHFTLVDDPIDPLKHIMYFNPLSEKQPGEDEYEDWGLSYLEAFRDSIVTYDPEHPSWILEKMRTLPGPLYIIVINHGSPDYFNLTPTQGFSDEDLGNWLTDLQTRMADEEIPPQDIVVILGSCYSASFIDVLSGASRIVVASAAHDEPSYRGAKQPGGIRDGEFFITALFDAWALDDEFGNAIDLKTAFQSAVESTETHTDSGLSNSPSPYFDTAMQHPHLDDDANGQGSNTLTPGGDGDVAQIVYLGWGTAAPDPVVVTEVGKVPETPITGNTATLWATVSDNDPKPSVWVEIRNPGKTLGGGEEQQIVDLIEVKLTWNASGSRYDAPYDQFTDEGRYTLFFYAKDNTGIISPFKKTYLYKSPSINDPPGEFSLLCPEDGSVTTTTVGLGAGWDVSVDPEGDDVTYTLEIWHDPTDSRWGTDTFYYKKEGITRNMCIIHWEANFVDWKSYIWHVTAIDEYGAETTCNDPWGFDIDDNNPGNGWLDIMVYDKTTDCLIDHAVVIGSGSLAVEDFGSGYFLGYAPAGDYSVTVSAAGYETEDFGVTVVENDTVVREFGLEPLTASPASALPAILLLLLGE